MVNSSDSLSRAIRLRLIWPHTVGESESSIPSSRRFSATSSWKRFASCGLPAVGSVYLTHGVMNGANSALSTMKDKKTALLEEKQKLTGTFRRGRADGWRAKNA